MQYQRFSQFIVIAAAILVAVLSTGSIRSQFTFREQPIACDDFGYLRQGQLFRDKGLIGGLDTEIKDPMTQALVAIAKSTGLPPETWQESVAPHCHHYKVSSGKVILTYPPGTGLLISPWPDGVGARYMVHGVSIVLVLALLATLAIRPTLVSAAGVAWLAFVFFYGKSWLGTSWSSMASLPFVVALAIVTATRLDFEKPDLRWHAFAGLILGLSINERIPNGFLLAGFLVAYGCAFLLRPNVPRFTAALCFGLASIAGLLPTLIANAINAGSPFASPYSAVNSALPVLSWSSFVDGFTFFSTTARLSGKLILASIAPVVVLAVVLIRRFDRQSAWTLLIIVINLTTNLGYFILHDPREGYYPATIAIFSATASVYALIRLGPPVVLRLMSREINIACGIVLAVVIGFTIFHTRPVSPLYTDPAAHPEYDRNTIVWGDLTASYLHYFKHRQASKLATSAPAVQEKLVRAVRDAGHDQVLIAEPPNMTAAIARLSSVLPVEKIGRAYDYDTYLIRAARSPPAGETAR